MNTGGMASLKNEMTTGSQAMDLTKTPDEPQIAAASSTSKYGLSI